MRLEGTDKLTPPNSRIKLDWLSAAVLAGTTIILLYHLGQAPVFLWDEARVAVNALEMIANHNVLVTTFHGRADFWNPKPTLAIAPVALSMAFGGINEIALRLPAALSGVGTVMACYAVTHWITRRRSWAILAAAILVGTGGFVEAHVARSAEPDSMLVLFLSLTTFSLLRAADPPEGRSQFWTCCAAASFACAILTKGVAALLFVPGLAIGLLAVRGHGLLRTRAALLSLVGIGLLAVAYWGGREALQPGFLAAVWHMEISRYGSSVYQAGAPWYVYLLALIWPWVFASFVGAPQYMATSSAFPWSLVVLATAPFALRSGDARVRKAATFIICVLATFLAVLSAGTSKLLWYVAPAFPLIAVLAAIGIQQLALVVGRWRGAPGRALGALLQPCAFIVAAGCIVAVIAKNEQEARSAIDDPNERLAYFLRETAPTLRKGIPVRILSDAKVAFPVFGNGRLVGKEPYDGPAEFYIAAMQRGGLDSRMVGHDYRPSSGDVVIGCGAIPWGNAVVRRRRGECFVLTLRGAPASTAGQAASRR